MCFLLWGWCPLSVRHTDILFPYPTVVRCRAMVKNLVSYCPIEDGMQLLSGRLPTLLLYYLSDGTKRFSDLRRDDPTISHKMLTLELRKLEDAGIVRRTEFDEIGRASCRESVCQDV